MRVLVVNVGSSSVKLRLLGDEDEVLASADPDPTALQDPASLLRALAIAPQDVGAVGHRVVHGGPVFGAPAVIDQGVLAGLEQLVPLAPLHQPAALRGIRAAQVALPGVAHVACFDTSFHRTLPAAASTYAIPERWRTDHGIRRYGFHGLSHAYASRRAVELTGHDAQHARVVSCHLGAGASVAAVQGGRSVDTTMGFTPLEGLVMATRSGTIDPAIPSWLVRNTALDADAVDDALEHESGLLGLTGSEDMREVLQRATAGDEAAALGLGVYMHRLLAGIGAMAAAMDGLDVLAFTGGVGEHAWEVRRRTAAGLTHLGLGIDDDANRAATFDAVISSPRAAATTVVVEAREDLEIARAVRIAVGEGDGQ